MRREIKNLIANIEERSRAFYEALEGEDDLGVVVRAHICIEHELRHFVHVKAPAPEHVDFDRIDYSATLALALILGLPKHLRPPLKALGSLRNKFSHRMGAVLTRGDANDIYEKLSPAARRDMKDAMDKVAPLFPGRTGQPSKMNAKDLLATACCALHLEIMSAAVHAAHTEVMPVK